MENTFTHCQHCGTLNFQEQKYCNYCSFRLPVTEKPSTDFYKRWNATVIQTILILIALFVVLAFSVRVL